MNEFKEYHPVAGFVYFELVITFSMFFMHPVCLALSFLGAFLYCLILGRAKTILYALPVAAFAAVLNPLFNHSGATVLFYFGNGNPFTAESVYYGLAAAAMLCAVICWFSCFGAVMTGDKTIYLFGRIIPSMSLVISMILRLIPEFKRKMREIGNARKGLFKSYRLKDAVSVFGALVSASLEGAVETADSMSCRGYGLKHRSAYSNYIFTKRDAAVCIACVLTGAYTVIGAAEGALGWRYFPSVSGAEITPYGISVFAAYFIMCLMPVIIEAAEVCRWKAIKSKI